jgi:hypothetical protein
MGYDQVLEVSKIRGIIDNQNFLEVFLIFPLIFETSSD